MNKGIVLFALGHPAYGQMAHQLCMSLKFSAPEIPITLYYTDSAVTHLNQQRKNHFDEMILLSSEYYTHNGRLDYLKPKTFLYELSPYKETIFIDVDTLWLPQKGVSKMFELLTALEFTMSCRSAIDVKDVHEKFIHWADSREIVKQYKITEGLLYNVSSEFIYFKKCVNTKKLFNQIRKAYDTLKVAHVFFGNGIPDELAFTIGLAITKTKLHQDIFVPCYWEPFHRKNMSPQDMYAQFWALSVGGAFQDSNVIELYNNLSKYYSNQFGVGYNFPLRNKSEYLPERQTI